jgi:hypothetical protein
MGQRTHPRGVRRVDWFVLALLALGTPASAQTGSVVGRVVDENGAALRGASVTLVGPNTRDTAPTDASGEYRFERGRPGTGIRGVGANALSGVVNVITKSPRQTSSLTTVNVSGGAFDRDVGSTRGRGAGATYAASVTTSQVASGRWSYRISAGYSGSDAFPRPTGRIPVIPDPRDLTGRTTVGGALYPADGVGPIGTAFQNRGTSQPKFDARVDQDLADGRVMYTRGVAGTEGIVHTGLGPFHVQRGSVMAYGRASYTRGAAGVSAFTNALSGEAPNVLVPDPQTGEPLQLEFRTQTYDIEGSQAHLINEHTTPSIMGETTGATSLISRSLRLRGTATKSGATYRTMCLPAGFVSRSAHGSISSATSTARSSLRDSRPCINLRAITRCKWDSIARTVPPRLSTTMWTSHW